jgi:hypothetical protein
MKFGFLNLIGEIKFESDKRDDKKGHASELLFSDELYN